ncbi:ankyrin repeat domain-containing protein [Curvivirga sp.]|uniref:ankyrin repeat domain-containing protein n=1 Tax=Curvivirga sp. TaxID=2856848 RepID=UPI003B5C9269
MAKKPKDRETLEQLLASCSDTLFPAELGQASVSIDSRDVDGDTPLHVMVWRENIYGVSMLIEAGADVNAVGDMSETPLHVAVKLGNLAIIDTLLKVGANTSMISEFGETPMGLAAKAGGEVLKCVSK